MKLFLYIILIISANLISGQTADVFLENGRIEGNLYKFDISITQTSTWGPNFLSNYLGSSSFRVTRNSVGLDVDPVISAIGPFFDNTSYSLTTQIINEQINVEVNFTFQGTSAALVTNTKYLFCTIALTILDPNEVSGILWVPVSTAVFDGDDDNVISALIGDLSISPLPVELTSFEVVQKDETTLLLNWETATEVNNYGFEIERSSTSLGTISDRNNNPSRAETREWETIGFVEGHGNSNSPNSYNFVDEDLTGGNYFAYRLKQIDIDGAYEYSDLVELNFVPKKYELSQNYPNPFNPSTTIKFSLPKNGKVRLDIYNMLGERVTTLIDKEMDAGFQSIQFNASNLASGVYFYMLQSGKYIQSKKMIILK